MQAEWGARWLSEPEQIIQKVVLLRKTLQRVDRLTQCILWPPELCFLDFALCTYIVICLLSGLCYSRLPMEGGPSS